MSEASRGDPLSWGLPLATLLAHLATAKGYGYFRDELYYLACSEHLGLGYVDHPPLVAWITAASRAVLGDSLPAIRFVPAVCAGVAVLLAMSIAREMGGGRFARVLAGLAVMLAPIYLSLFGILSMNCIDVALWAAVCLVTVKALRGENPSAWILFGLLAGIGLENKISMLFLGFGITAGLLVCGRFRTLRSRGFWLGGAIAALVFAPHLLWQAANGWPTLEFMENARRIKMLPMSPLAFLREQVLFADPLALPIWLSGLGYLLLARRARALRPLGVAYLVVLAVLLATHGKPYYLAPIYTLLFAAGAVAIEEWTERRGRLLRSVAGAAVVLGGLAAAPLAKPILPIGSYVSYAARLGFSPGTDERHEVGRLPQFFADMRGWPELAETVAQVFRSLPPADRERACIFGQNYGQAGAIDLFGPALSLPKAISAHNSYFLWGPGTCTGEVLIVIDDEREVLERLFTSVEEGAEYTCDDCMPYENHKAIWIARGLKTPISELWPRIKNFI